MLLQSSPASPLCSMGSLLVTASLSFFGTTLSSANSHPVSEGPCLVSALSSLPPPALSTLLESMTRWLSFRLLRTVFSGFLPAVSVVTCQELKSSSANLFCLVTEFIMSQDPSVLLSLFFLHPSLKAAFVYSDGTTIHLFPSIPPSTGLLGIAVLLFFETLSLALYASGLFSASLSWLVSYCLCCNAWIQVTVVLGHFP